MSAVIDRDELLDHEIYNGCRLVKSFVEGKL